MTAGSQLYNCWEIHGVYQKPDYDEYARAELVEEMSDASLTAAMYHYHPHEGPLPALFSEADYSALDECATVP